MKRLFTLANGRTYWQGDSGYYQVSASPDDVPSGETGYGRLESIMRLKGDLPATPTPYAELDKLAEYRATTRGFDTSGYVETPPAHFIKTADAIWRWGDLSPFAQGYVEAMARANFEAVALLPSDNDENGLCKHCGRDNTGEEDGPCSDDCPRQEIRFADLAPETLARIIADCDARFSGWFERCRADGVWFWKTRQRGEQPDFPPLTIRLGDDGRARFA